jgi:insulysin
MKLPFNENRIFKTNKLENGIKYTIIQDEIIDTSTICIAIKAGSFSEPKDYNGLAHFLEHMLFLGSKKFPKENYFDETLKKYGGVANAYTAPFETVYYFSVNDEYFDEMMDIFSQFFINPLFDINSVNKEINAVNSEHNKNIDTTIWHKRHIIRMLSNENSLVHNFSTGNLDTLNKKDVRDKMILFYNQFYICENISISLVSPRSINDIEPIFKNIFNNITRKGNENIIIKNNIYYSNKGNEYVLQNINDKNYIVYFWEVDLPHKYTHNMIGNIISEIISNNDDNNLEDVLIKNNLIKNLYSYYIEDGVIILVIDINNINDIKIINKYVKYYFDNLINFNWDSIYDFVDKKYNILFNYLNKVSSLTLVQNIAVNSHYFLPEYYYYGSYGIVNKDYQLLKDTIKTMKFDNAIIFYCSKLLQGDLVKDKYYNLLFGKIYQSFKSKKGIDYKYNIVLYNQYFDTTPQFYDNLTIFEIPQLINKRIWYGSSSKFKESFVKLRLILTDKTFFNNIENFTISNISIDIINYYLNKKFNKHNEIGYNCNLYYNSLYSNIDIHIEGYNCKFNDFFYEIIEYLKNIDVKDNIINNIILEYIEELNEIFKLKPWEYARKVINNIINPYKYTYEDKYNYILNNKNNINNHIKQFVYKLTNFINIPITVFIYGNVLKNNLPIFDKLQPNFNIPLFQPPRLFDIVNTNIKHPNKDEKSNYVMILFKLNYYTPFHSAIEIIINTIMKQPCFDFLRTKQQLGYLVDTSFLIMNNLRYMYIAVQSEKNIKVVFSKIIQFIKNFNDILLNTINNDLDKIKKTVHKILLKKENNTDDLLNKYYSEIYTRDYMFNRNQLITYQLDNISKDDIYNYYLEIIRKPKYIKIYS